MGKLVNYKKRSVQLPHGCKDLIEVLNAKPPGTSSSGSSGISVFGTPVRSVESSEATVTVSSLRDIIAELLASGSWVRAVVVSVPNESLRISFNAVAEDRNVSVVSVNSPERSRAIEEFMKRRGISPSKCSSTPNTSAPAIPLLSVFTFNPFPMEAPALANLFEQILEEVEGLKADSKVVVCRVEFEKRGE